MRKALPFPLPVPIGSNQTEPFDFRLGPDGKVWTYLGGALVRIDPRDTSVEPVGRIALGGRIAFSGSDIYLAGSERLRRVAGVVPIPSR